MRLLCKTSQIATSAKLMLCMEMFRLLLFSLKFGQVLSAIHLHLVRGRLIGKIQIDYGVS
ncbi:hypothetical protein BK671_22255 [Pseudomonas fluorescens]|uniref:Uncharacterized protein n=1 Tax=Pseudomonas fluorescens TaxID=294 RepID=A0A423L4E3_PSEFL|nr:hypothetical protein BK671_22255 [Pseudomonas fluorescens]